LFDFLGWARPWDPENTRDLPDHMLVRPGEASAPPPPNTNFREP
jgi:hypothetical protein